MTTRLGVAEPSAAERLEPVLGGAPLPAAYPVPGQHERQAGKRRKREGKLRRDAERPPESFERFRILSELVDQGRQVIELADHRARYALVVMSVLNAFVFLVISRSHLLGELPPTFRTWLIGFMGLYGVLTFIFVFYAVDCLRPRPLQVRGGAGGPEEREAGAARHPLLGRRSPAMISRRFRRAWSEARMEQLNAEVVIIAYRLARVVRAKYLDLGRLYLGLGGAGGTGVRAAGRVDGIRAHGLKHREYSRRR